MNVAQISIVSLWPDPKRPLDLDLKHIFSALSPLMSQYVWCVRKLEWLEDLASTEFCEKVESARPNGLWVSSKDLVAQISRVYQTIEGELTAFPANTAPRSVLESDLNLRYFPSNRASLAVLAVDGTFFEVFAKNPEELRPLFLLKGARAEDPSVYF